MQVTRYTLHATRSRGFTLYYTVLISSVLLTVGASMLNLALKEFLLSASLRESEYAFLAADSGVECALYWDLKEDNVFPVYREGGGPGVLRTANPGAVANYRQIRCNGNDLMNPPVVFAFTNKATTYLTYNVNGAYCVKVEVQKTKSPVDGSISTVIDARGYNLPGVVTPNPFFFCDNNKSSRKVERAMVTQY